MIWLGFKKFFGEPIIQALPANESNPHRQGWQHMESLGDILGFKTENSLNLVVLHENETDAVAQVAVNQAQVLPQVQGTLVSSAIHPSNIDNTEHVAMPQLGSCNPDVLLQLDDGLENDIAAGQQHDRVF